MKNDKNHRHIEFRQWRQFLAVADELHFGRAAARLAMTQPPLTQAIAGLEALLGVRLFERTKRSVKLTPAGAALRDPVRELLARAAALPVLARAAAAGETGALRLAFVSTIGFSWLPQWVQGFRQRFAGVRLELIEATGDQQLTALAGGGIDAGFVLHASGLAPPGLAQLRVAREPLCVALPAQHLLAARASLTLADVLAEPLVVFPRRIAPSLHDAIFGLYTAGGRTPQVAQEAIQMQTIVNLVSAGLGLAWVPESVQQFQRDGVVYRHVQAGAGAALPVCETSLVWPRHVDHPVRDRFVAFLRDVLDRAGP